MPFGFGHYSMGLRKSCIGISTGNPPCCEKINSISSCHMPWICLVGQSTPRCCLDSWHIPPCHNWSPSPSSLSSQTSRGERGHSFFGCCCSYYKKKNVKAFYFSFLLGNKRDWSLHQPLGFTFLLNENTCLWGRKKNAFVSSEVCNREHLGRKVILYHGESGRWEGVMCTRALS